MSVPVSVSVSVPVLETHPQFKFTPFYAIVEDGLDRMLDIFEQEEFTFFVKGSKVKSTVAEAVLISPKVYDSILNDRSIRSFVLSDDGIDVAKVEKFLSFVRSRDCESFLGDNAHSFLTLSRLFGNERFFLFFLHQLDRLDQIRQKRAPKDQDCDLLKVTLMFVRHGFMHIRMKIFR
jgi:hypothetical protein